MFGGFVRLGVLIGFCSQLGFTSASIGVVGQFSVPEKDVEGFSYSIAWFKPVGKANNCTRNRLHQTSFSGGSRPEEYEAHTRQRTAKQTSWKYEAKG